MPAILKIHNRGISFITKVNYSNRYFRCCNYCRETSKLEFLHEIYDKTHELDSSEKIEFCCLFYLIRAYCWFTPYRHVLRACLRQQWDFRCVKCFTIYKAERCLQKKHCVLLNLNKELSF